MNHLMNNYIPQLFFGKIIIITYRYLFINKNILTVFLFFKYVNFANGFFLQNILKNG